MGAVPFAGIAEAVGEDVEVGAEGMVKAVSGCSFERPGVEYEKSAFVMLLRKRVRCVS